MKKIIIIGTGLSGLSCAFQLKKSNINVELYEKTYSSGGRVNSEYDKNFIYDVGFQVLLNNYNELKKIGIYKKLKIKYFNSGAKIFYKGEILNIYNPIYHPIKFLKSNYSKVFKLKDLYKLITLVLNIRKTNNFSKADFFLKKNFSKKSLKLFFYPFFRGIFLSKKIDTSFTFFLKIIRKFTFGRAGLPENGMAEIPKKLIEIAQLKINYGYELEMINRNKAYFKNGNVIEFEKIVIAMPLEEIKKIIKINTLIANNSNFTCYIKSNINCLGKTMVLVPENKYEINSIQCLSNIAKNYSKYEESLYSVSSLNHNVDLDKIKIEFSKITKIDEKEFSIVKTFRIKYALPKTKQIINNQNNIYFCGDWNTEPSIDGALKSGRLVAEKIINS